MSEVVDLTRKLIGLPTVTGEISLAQVEVVQSMLREQGYSTRNINGNLLATMGSGEKHLALISHYDVVPPGEGWNRDPYSASLDDGIIYGRGACDMKSGVAAHIVAGKQLADLGMKVSLFISADEETGSRGMPLLLEENEGLIDYAIGGEPTSKSAHSGDVVKVGRRGLVHGALTFHGQQGHGAYPERVRNVVHDLPKIIPAILYQLDKGNSEFPASGCSITGVKAGEGRYNVIPGKLTVSFDARLSSETTPEQFEAGLHEQLNKLGIKYDYERALAVKSYRTPDTEFRKRALEGIVNSTGKSPDVNTEGGSSDARFFAHKGIPTIEVGVPQGNMHGADEFVVAEEVDRLVKIYAEIGKSLLR